jgi:hypothetical protein
LHQLLEKVIRSAHFDAIIHCAAVSDYESAGTFAPAPGTQFHHDGTWTNKENTHPRLEDRQAGKVKSD